MFKSNSFGHITKIMASVSLIACALGSAFAEENKEKPTDLKIPATIGGLKTDMISSKAILKNTTHTEYLTDWVSAIPDHPDVPSPRDYLGHIAGAAGELTNVDEIHGYMKAIANSSDRATIINLGKSHEGRDMIMIAIADPETIKNLSKYRENLQRLSDPRRTTQAEANKIIKGAKPIYWITAGLHSTELGPPETVMELAYRLVVEEREVFKNIRKNVITMITPVLEVDGRSRSTEWYHKHSKGHTDAYNRPPSSPPFWGHYTFHDNNRDGIAATQPLTKNFLKAFMDWKPTLSLDLHESVPFLYVSGGTGPFNPGVSSTTITEWQAIANYEVSKLTAKGMPGVWTWGFYTGWYPGYLLWVTNNHNSHGRFYETYGNGSAETMMRDMSSARYAGKKVTSKQWYRATPPPKHTLWSMRNNVNFMQSGVIASLEYVSRHSDEFLENFYHKGVEGIRKGTASAPYAIVIPKDQRDKGSARELIDLIQRQAIEVDIATANGTYGKIKIKKGDAVIRMDQPYAVLAKTLFENQKFPKDVQHPPYDDVAWTLGLLRGVKVIMVDDKKVLDHKSKTIMKGRDIFKTKKISKSAKYYVIAHKGQEGLGELRFSLPKAKMMAAKKSVKIGKVTYPAGSVFIEAKSVDRNELQKVIENTLLDITPIRRLPKGEMIDMDLPRIAMLHSWTSTQDPGWLRYSLDQANVPYTLLEKTEIRAGNLQGKYDVILVPHFRGGLKRLIKGISSKWSPLAYETTEETPSHGHILSSKDITGGYGYEGIIALDAFVKSGGTMITLGGGGSIATDSGIVSDISLARAGGVNTPGSVITMKILNSTSPLTFGYDKITHAFRGNMPFYRVSKENQHLVLAQFGTKKAAVRPWDEPKKGKDKKKPKKGAKLVLSGVILKGEKTLNGAPAILSHSAGKGQVVMFGWNPMHRHLNHHDHAFVYNALMFWNDLKVKK